MTRQTDDVYTLSFFTKYRHSSLTYNTLINSYNHCSQLFIIPVNYIPIVPLESGDRRPTLIMLIQHVATGPVVRFCQNSIRISYRMRRSMSVMAQEHPDPTEGATGPSLPCIWPHAAPSESWITSLLLPQETLHGRRQYSSFPRTSDVTTSRIAPVFEYSTS